MSNPLCSCGEPADVAHSHKMSTTNFTQEAGRTYEATTSTTSSGEEAETWPCPCIGCWADTGCQLKPHVLPPTPPNEVDERSRLANELLRLPDGKNLGMKWDMDVLIDYITKQNQAYHAAGLRELQLTFYDVGYDKVQETIGQAIAEQERRAAN